MTDIVAEFRRSRVLELDELVHACVGDPFRTESQVATIVTRVRELYYFAPDLRGMAEQLREVALRQSLAVWAEHNMELLTKIASRGVVDFGTGVGSRDVINESC
jgi:hypothetical protein